MIVSLGVELCTYLWVSLFDFMVFFAFVVFDALLWTLNGKIDCNVLFVLDCSRYEVDTVVAVLEIDYEWAIVLVW